MSTEKTTRSHKTPDTEGLCTSRLPDRPTVSPAKNSLVYFYINSLHRSSSMEKPSRGGEKRTAAWASHHEERGSDGAIAPPMGDHRVVLHRCVVREWCTPSGSAVAPCLHAAARTRRAARAVKGDVLSVWQVLHETPSAPPIPAQRVARFDDHCTRNCLLQNKLRQRYSRSIVWIAFCCCTATMAWW